MNLTTRAKLLTALAGLGLVLAGAVGGAWIAAPSLTDQRNACVADTVVTRAGLPPGVVPGPASDPYSDPRTISTTPPVVTPLTRP